MPLPTTFVLGVQKAGTTWIHHALSSHPAIHVPKEKELHFFDKQDIYDRGIDWYSSQFDGYNPRKHEAIANIEANAFWVPKSSVEAEQSNHRLSHHLNVVGDLPSSTKFIVILRDPVQRAISAFYHLITYGYLSPTSRILDAWHQYGIRSMGDYVFQLQRWNAALLSPDRLLILDYDTDIKPNKAITLARVYGFCGVNSGYAAHYKDKQVNSRVSHLEMRLKSAFGKPGMAIARALPRSIRDRPEFAIPVTTTDILEMHDYYNKANAGLEELIGRELVWRKSAIAEAKPAVTTLF